MSNFRVSNAYPSIPKVQAKNPWAIAYIFRVFLISKQMAEPHSYLAEFVLVRPPPKFILHELGFLFTLCVSTLCLVCIPHHSEPQGILAGLSLQIYWAWYTIMWGLEWGTKGTALSSMSTTGFSNTGRWWPQASALSTDRMLSLGFFKFIGTEFFKITSLLHIS